MKELDILFEDKNLIAINKPSGLLVHRSDIDRRETRSAMQMLRDQLGQWVYPVHRLDKATSGVLLFALNRESARQMTVLFEDRNIVKSYLAIVRGFTREADCIEYSLKEVRRNIRPAEQAADRPVHHAVTEYRRMGTIELLHPVGRYASARYSLIKACPLTGRSHQIRRHMKHIFHPVVGDTTYGDGKQNDFFRRKFGCQRLLLHAQEMKFLHPYCGTSVHIAAPLDPYFSELLVRLQWNDLLK